MNLLEAAKAVLSDFQNSPELNVPSSPVCKLKEAVDLAETFEPYGYLVVCTEGLIGSSFLHDKDEARKCKQEYIDSGYNGEIRPLYLWPNPEAREI